jgi:DNA gyrase subunit A
VVGIAGVDEDTSVFIATSEGRGTIRLMSGFNPNKSAGVGGKIIINASDVIGALTVKEGSDLFMISRLGKIIRFMAAEVPEKEGTVQGVNCMALRSDEVTALAVSYLE